MIGGSLTGITAWTGLLRNVSRCAPSILSAFHSSAPSHTPKRKTTDAIISDNPPRHFGTPEEVDAASPFG